MKSWSVEDQPREKYLRLGGQKLTDAELLAIVIGNGSVGQSALSLAKSLLIRSGNDLQKLFELSVENLMDFKGVGKVKAVKIKASLDLGYRLLPLIPSKPLSLSSSAAAFSVLKPVLIGLAHEEFWVLYLDNAHVVLERSLLGKGGFTATVVDIRLVLQQALKWGATAMIVAHNHPTGNLTPSAADKTLTLKLKDAAKLLDMVLLDHIIVGKNEYFSFADQQLL
ncbi:MAG: DNA repair protein RadC [Flavobacteriaceae bacterium]|nr:DNA repair protein RadC [Flavobacteriaceae bacterium]MDG2415755.1 DNA repair protein RadC [Flavobacteriaceae bacterium]